MRKAPPRRRTKAHVRGDLRAVVDETIALFHRLRWVAEQIYGEPGRSTARRGVLRGLVRYGPQTVPALARARAVSRQHVQGVVDALVRDGLARLEDNPRHRRSRLVVVTERGEALVRRLDEIDDRVLAAAGARLPTAELASAARTLTALRGAFEDGSRWRRAAGLR